MATGRTRTAESLDLTLCLGRSLFQSRDLEQLRDLLSSHAPAWTSDLHIQRHRRRREVDDFAHSVRQAASERGALFAELTDRFGPSPYERQTGSVELRGADSSLIVVIHLDDYTFSPSAGRWLWGNTITLQVCRARVGEKDAETFVERFAIAACSRLSPWYAHGHLAVEFHARNISTEGGGMRAIGIDYSRYLPGLYWLNFFGDPYCRLIGQERLLGAPSHMARVIDEGVLLRVNQKASSWNCAESRAQQVLTHIGEQYFFDREHPERETVAPDFSRLCPAIRT